MKSQVNNLYQEWQERFLQEWEQPHRYIPSFLPSSEQHFREEQIEFIRIYLGHMLIDGESKQNLNRIKNFLKMQGAINKDTEFEFRFLNGNPKEVFLYAQSPDQIDIADIIGITDFQRMHVYMRNDKFDWAAIIAEDFLEFVREDIEFDGIEAELNYRFEGKLLEIDFKFL